jgi:hypothetical protein
MHLQADIIFREGNIQRLSYSPPLRAAKRGMTMCLIAEIIHSCSHEKVAQAAVVSMGADFAGKVGVTAGAHGLSIGAFTARTIREFERSVGEREKQALRAVMQRADQPILTGLQHILLPVVAVNDRASPRP